MEDENLEGWIILTVDVRFSVAVHPSTVKSIKHAADQSQLHSHINPESLTVQGCGETVRGFSTSQVINVSSHEIGS